MKIESRVTNQITMLSITIFTALSNVQHTLVGTTREIHFIYFHKNETAHKLV